VSSFRSAEATFDVLARLIEIKFASGIIDELLYLDHPRENRFPNGLMMLEYRKAVQETVHEQFRVVREGHLRIIFSPDLKVSRKIPWLKMCDFLPIFFCPAYLPKISSNHQCANAYLILTVFLSRYCLGSFVLGVMKSFFFAGLLLRRSYSNCVALALTIRSIRFYKNRLWSTV